MSWARLDDGFHDHPKIVATSNGAVGLYCKALTYCTRHLTDGVIPAAIVARVLGGTDAEVDELLRNNLWRRDGESLRIVNYLTYQPSSKSVKKEKKRAKEGMRALRARRATGVTRNTGWDGMGRESSSSSSRVKGESEGKGGKRPLPPDYPLTDELRADAIRLGCRDPERMHGAFVDYWRGTGKPMADWRATFRRWARNAHDGSPGKACGCVPRPGAKVTTMDAARSLAARWAAEGKLHQ